MTGKSAIEWTEATWNPIVGCSLVSPGCTHCYAMGQAARQIRCAAGLGRATHYAGTTRTVKGRAVWTGQLAQAPEHILLAPLKRKKPTTYFVNSMGDLFHEDCPDAWIDRVFAVMALCPQHTFQILTKRSARMREYMNSSITTGMIGQCAIDIFHDLPHRLSDWPLPNVWLGVSAEDQRRADERRDDLGGLAAQGWTTFVSYEPALGPIDWNGWDFLKQLISGGESGAAARPSKTDWQRAARDFCRPRARA